MSGISIKANSASFASANVLTSLTLPIRSGLIGEYVLGTDSNKTCRNRANPALSMTVVGTPVYTSANSVEVRSGGSANSYGFNTGIAAPNDCTVLVIRKIGVGTGRVFSTDYPPTGFISANSNFSFANGSNPGPNPEPTLTTPADTAPFYFLAGSGSVGVAGKIYLYQNGVVSTNTGTQVSGARTASPFMFGVDIDANEDKTTEVAYGAIFNRILSAADIALCYASLQSFYAAAGVVVS